MSTYPPPLPKIIIAKDERRLKSFRDYFRRNLLLHRRKSVEINPQKQVPSKTSGKNVDKLLCDVLLFLVAMFLVTFAMLVTTAVIFNAQNKNRQDDQSYYLAEFEEFDEQITDFACSSMGKNAQCVKLIDRLKEQYDTSDSRVDFKRVWLVLQARGFDDEFRSHFKQLYDGIFGNVTFDDDFYGPGPQQSLPKGFSGILVVDVLKNGPFIDLTELRYLSPVTIWLPRNDPYDILDLTNFKICARINGADSQVKCSERLLSSNFTKPDLTSFYQELEQRALKNRIGGSPRRLFWAEIYYNLFTRTGARSRLFFSNSEQNGIYYVPRHRLDSVFEVLTLMAEYDVPLDVAIPTALRSLVPEVSSQVEASSNGQERYSLNGDSADEYGGYLMFFRAQARRLPEASALLDKNTFGNENVEVMKLLSKVRCLYCALAAQ